MNQVDDQSKYQERMREAVKFRKTVLDLKYGETATFENLGLFVVCVPGGWLYQSFDPNSKDDLLFKVEAMCFVPYNDNL